ncbi:hypothetical protein [Rathayibacter sp. AY1E6]|uniref:hypothetical protein n=1 Tax=Rathayibacter sp. AY1E6 TaxID=2080554 RepID=UPI0011B08166|nr:hypothetical protein [Rathayibacter sp. AY1E6]
MFDVNIYLDMARLLGPPFTWSKFSEAAARQSGSQVPSTDYRVDSLRAIATTISGRFLGEERLEVWTSHHIDDLAFDKLVQPENGEVDEERGLGWSDEHAQSFTDSFIDELAFDMTSGGTIGDVEISYGSPPLSHEDGCVYRTAEASGAANTFYRRFCITRDRDFRTATIPGDIVVLYPWEWLEYVRSARSRLATTAMRPRPATLPPA